MGRPAKDNAVTVQAKGVVGEFGNCARLSALAEERCGPSKCRFCYGKCRFCLPNGAEVAVRAAKPVFACAKSWSQRC